MTLNPLHATRSSPVGNGLYRARVFPNGEFGVGRVPARSKSARDKLIDNKKIVDGVLVETLPRCHELPDGTKLYDANDKYESPSSVNLAYLSNHHEGIKRRYGAKGLTANGKRSIRNGCFLLQRAVRPGQKLCMATLTVPSLPMECMKHLNDNWGDVVRRYFQKIKRLCKKQGHSFEYVGCTEIQPSRFANTGVPALHLHYCYRSVFLRSRGVYVVPFSLVRLYWKSAIREVVSRFAPLEAHRLESWIPNFRNEEVSKNAGAYMSKYISKADEQLTEVVAACGEEYLPRQWWYISARLRESIVRNTSEFSCVLAERLLSLCRHPVAHIVEYVYCVEIDTPANGLRIVGYGGKLVSKVSLGLRPPCLSALS